MRRRGRGTRIEAQEEVTINLTPLIDVVFVVLIIFILIAPLLEIDRVELSSGTHKSHGTSAEGGNLTLHVHRDNTIWLNGRCVAEDQLLSSLRALRQTGGKNTLQLFQDKQAYFGTYQMIKNNVEMAGFEELQVVLKP